MTKIWKGKRFISLVLSLALLVSMLPPLALPANSEEVPQEDTPQVEEEVQYNSGVYGALIGATGTLNFDQWNMMYVSDDPMVDVSEAQELYATDIPVWGLQLVVEAVHWDAETSALWLKVAAAEGYSLPSKLQQYPWVYQNETSWYAELDWQAQSPDSLLLTLPNNGQMDMVTGVTVSGLPNNATLNVTDPSIDVDPYTNIFDIKAFDSNGNPWQPAVGDTVQVNLPACANVETATVLHFMESVEHIKQMQGSIEIMDASGADDALKELLSDAIAACYTATGEENKVAVEIFEDVPVINGTVSVQSSGFSCYILWYNEYMELDEDWESMAPEVTGTVYYVKVGSTLRFDTSEGNYNNLATIWKVASSDMDATLITWEGERTWSWSKFGYDYKVVFTIPNNTSLVDKTFTLRFKEGTEEDRTVKFQILGSDQDVGGKLQQNTYLVICPEDKEISTLFGDFPAEYQWYSNGIKDDKELYASTPAGIVYYDTFNKSMLVENQGSEYVFTDSEGRKTKEFADVNVGLQQDIIAKMYPNQNTSDYVVIVYGVKRVGDGTSNRTEWYVVCKIQKKDTVRVIFDPNTPDGYNIVDAQQLMPANIPSSTGQTVTLSGLAEKLNKTISRTENKQTYTATLVGWSTDPGANPNAVGGNSTWYKDGDKVYLPTDLTLYAIWSRTDAATYHAADIYFRNHVQDESGRTFENLDGEFSFTVSENFKGYQYQIYKSTGVADGEKGTFGEGASSFILVGDQYIVIENVGNLESQEYTITADEKPGHTYPTDPFVANGVEIIGNKCNFTITTTTNHAGEFYADFTNVVTEYTLQYDSNGASSIEEVKYTIYDELSLPELHLQGSAFEGWKPVVDTGSWKSNQLYPVGTLSGMYGDVTLQAQWKAALASLTIDVNFANNAPVDETQTFIFQVTGDGVDVTVVVQGGGQVVIAGLTIGRTYTITPKNAWSWRYGDMTEATVTIAIGGSTETFQVSRSDAQWLDSNDYYPKRG